MPNPQNVTGAKRSRGKPFTSETARLARQKRTEKERAQASVLAEFRKLATGTVVDRNGVEHSGAQVIAQAIFKGCADGNPRMIQLALEMIGEAPDKNVNVNATVQHGDFVLEICGEPDDDD